MDFCSTRFNKTSLKSQSTLLAPTLYLIPGNKNSFDFCGATEKGRPKKPHGWNLRLKRLKCGWKYFNLYTLVFQPLVAIEINRGWNQPLSVEIISLGPRLKCMLISTASTAFQPRPVLSVVFLFQNSLVKWCTGSCLPTTKSPLNPQPSYSSRWEAYVMHTPGFHPGHNRLPC